MIHPTAIVEPGAQLGAGCEIMAHAIVTRHCLLGERVVVHPFAVLGGDPQYLQFDPAGDGRVSVGAGTVIREHVTVNRSIQAGGVTVVGAACFLMATSHVAHDCELAEQVVLANAVLLAGHVSVGARTFFGGGAAVHQFCRLGESVMVAGHASITKDVPPFTMVAERDDLIGLNSVGLRRFGIARPAIAELKATYQELYAAPGNLREIAAELRAAKIGGVEEVGRFLAFFAEGKRSFARPRRSGVEPGTSSGGTP
jgi:UDP-N-acetylglucosamine acyltransferase